MTKPKSKQRQNKPLVLAQGVGNNDTVTTTPDDDSYIMQGFAAMGFGAPVTRELKDEVPLEEMPIEDFDFGIPIEDFAAQDLGPHDASKAQAPSYGGAYSYRATNNYLEQRDYAASSGMLPQVDPVHYGDVRETPANAFDKPQVEPFVMAQGAGIEVAQGQEPTSEGDGAGAGAGADTIAMAQSMPSEFERLQLKPDMGPKEREAARLVALKTCYRPEVIYGDPAYFTPVEPEPSEALTKEQELMFEGVQLSMMQRTQLSSRSVLACAYFSSLVPKINLAFCTYLQEHFPLGNFADQQRFNIVLLALFYQMREGDICLNLSRLEQLYEIVAQWQESLLNSLQHMAEIEEDSEHQVSMKEAQIAQDNERFLLMVKRYAPHSLEGIRAVLQRSLAVGFDPKVEPNAPLIFDQDRLYLRRYFLYEQGIVDYVAEVRGLELTKEQRGKLKRGLDLLFPPSPEIVGVNWQKVAAAMATTSSFTVISGGPGTGKTTTIMRILLLLICQDPSNRNIQMCAPTGKAAARMGESIGKQLKDVRMQENIAKLSDLFKVSSDDINSFLPKSASTVQGLIKTIPNRATPIYNAEHKLNCDVLVVDEVSMLDLALFYKLLAALKPECKLILLGDKDQLASVEAGKVLGDLCARLNESGADRINIRSLNLIAELSGYQAQDILSGKIADHVCLLQFSYRSKDVPEIGQLARIVNDNECVLGVQDESQLSASYERAWLAQKNLAGASGDIGSYLEACAQLGNFDRDPTEETLGRKSKVDQAYEQELRANLQPIYALLDKAKGESQGKSKKKEQAFKPAISLIELKQESQAEALCLERAQHAVAPYYEDNYAPFLQRLAELNFEISSDLNECEELFKLMDRFRILCSNHSGILGDKRLNEAIAQEVKQRYLSHSEELRPYCREKFFPGQIIIITKNDRVLDLVNGNVGFCAFAKPKDGGAKGERVLRVFIPVGAEEVDGRTVTKVTAISTLLLTNYDTGYAMSIHKSQGSEYDKVEIMLAERTNRVLTKELVYTAITRAKKCVTMVSSIPALYYSLAHSVERASGLSSSLAAISAQEQAQAQITESAVSKVEPPPPAPSVEIAQVPKVTAGTEVTAVGVGGKEVTSAGREKVAPAGQGEVAPAERAEVTPAGREEVVAIKPKRKRRTKAEMEAARATEAEKIAAMRAAGIELKPKRKRRTKAEMEAARSAEAAVKAQKE